MRWPKRVSNRITDALEESLTIVGRRRSGQQKMKRQGKDKDEDKE